MQGGLPSWAGVVCVGRREGQPARRGFIPCLALEKNIYGVSTGFLKAGADVAEGTNGNLGEGNAGVFYFLSE